MKTLKDIKKQFQKLGTFYTNEKLANLLKSQFDEKSVKTVYDPTCGCGNLLSVWGDDVEKFGQDINEDEIRLAKQTIKNGYFFIGDVLKSPFDWGQKFDAVVGNYPFSQSWEQQQNEINEGYELAPKSKADWQFVLTMLYFCKFMGKVATLCFPGLLYRGNKEGAIRKELVLNNYVEKVIAIPSGEFEDTPIATCLIVLNKGGKTTTDIIFEDYETKLSRVVSFDEIEKNDFNLSVSSYIQKQEEQKEEIDGKKLETEIQSEIIRQMKREIRVSKQVAEFENDPKLFENFLINLGRAIVE